MTALFDAGLYSGLTFVGLVWTLLTFWLMFSAKGRALLTNPWMIIVAFAALVPSIWYVVHEVKGLAAIAGGVPPLDVQYGYGRPEIVEFADALGPDGQLTYARFQLGADTLAPPAFACFLMAVFRSSVRLRPSLFVLTVLSFAYFVSVLIANTFMPVIIMNYPADEGGMLPALYAIVPICDLIKYSTHGLAWLTIFGSWIWQCAAWLLQRRSEQAV